MSTKVFLNDKEVYSLADVTNGSTIVQSIEHGMPNGGVAVLRIEATDNQGAKVEKTINLTIEKIKANLEVSRTASTQDIVPVNGEVKLHYVVNPKKVTGEAAKKITEDEKIISDVIYSETFPAYVDVVVPKWLKKEGSLEKGYTVTGSLPEIKYKRVGNEFIADSFSFEITVISKEKHTSTLNQSSIAYTDINNEKTTLKFNPITVRADYILDKIELPENIVINKDMSKNLSLDLEIYPKDVGIGEIVWSVTKGSDVLTVDPVTGVVEANKEGSGEVTVTVTDVFGNVKTAKTYITVRIPVENIEVSNMTLTVGETKPLPIKITPSEAINGVTIELDDPSIASINKETMEITGKTPGETIMKVRGINSEGEVVERTAIVKVEQIFVKTITVTPNPLRIDRNQVYTFDESNIKIEPDDATNKELVWKTTNSSIVSIEDNGKWKH